MTEKEALVLLNMVEGLGPVRIKEALTALDKAVSVFTADYNRLKPVFGDGLSQKIIAKRGSKEFSEELGLIERYKIDVLTILDPEYPPLLKECYSPPPVLYVKGNKNILREKCFAIVGSRRASFYGLNSSRKFAFELASLGLVIISGLARGIDSYAHKGALEAKGLTAGVLGSGILNIYPKENNKLAEEISDKGCVVSEFPLRTPPFKENFPRRNRIICGLCLGVLVVEAAQRSGALITAHIAIDEGRDVFALPGRIDSPLSKGGNSLIKQGAKLVEEISDILEELNIDVQQRVKDKKIPLSGEETRLYGLIAGDGVNIESLRKDSGLEFSELYRLLLELQVKKLVKEVQGKVYVRI